jgi:hypothetical protein
VISFGTVQQTFESGWPDGGRFGDRCGQAWALAHLGDARFAVGYLKTARQAWQQALAILDDLRHPDAEPVRTKLQQLDTAEAV